MSSTPFCAKTLRRSHNVLLLGIAPEGDDRRMFEQEQRVVDNLALAQIDQRLLQIQGGVVVDVAEMEDLDHGCSMSLRREEIRGQKGLP